MEPTIQPEPDLQPTPSQIQQALQSLEELNKPQLAPGYYPPEVLPQDRQKRWKREDFTIIRPLGNGQYGNVYLANEVASKYEVALKIIWKKTIEEYDSFDMVRREIEIQSHLRHPSVLKMFGYFYDDEKLYMVMEYAPGDLFRELNRVGRFRSNQAGKIFCELCHAVRYIHTKNVVHRDIKPENILLSGDGRAKLADFGCAGMVQGTMRRDTVCGTFAYLPPEMIDGSGHGKGVDIWALGVLLYEMLSGEEPFTGGDEDSQSQRILAASLTFPNYFSNEAKNIITRVSVCFQLTLVT